MDSKQTPSQEEIDHLFTMFKEHLNECPGFEASDITALEEVAKVWKTIKLIRRAGTWCWRITVSLGAFLIKAGAVVTAIVYLIQQIKTWTGK